MDADVFLQTFRKETFLKKSTVKGMSNTRQLRRRAARRNAQRQATVVRTAATTTKTVTSTTTTTTTTCRAGCGRPAGCKRRGWVQHPDVTADAAIRGNSTCPWWQQPLSSSPRSPPVMCGRVQQRPANAVGARALRATFVSIMALSQSSLAADPVDWWVEVSQDTHIHTHTPTLRSCPDSCHA